MTSKVIDFMADGKEAERLESKHPPPQRSYDNLLSLGSAS